MKRIIGGVVLVALLLGSSAAGAASKAPTNRMFVFGHSIAYGYGASSLTTSWAHIASTSTCRRLTNDAVASTNSSDALAAVQAAGPYKAGDVAVIETGLNDLRYWGADSAAAQLYWNNMAGMLWALRTADGTPVPVILVADPGVAAVGWGMYAPGNNGTQAIDDQYAEMEHQLVMGWPAATVVDVREQWSDADISADFIHPNDTGHAIIGYSVMAELQRRSLSHCHG